MESGITDHVWDLSELVAVKSIQSRLNPRLTAAQPAVYAGTVEAAVKIGRRLARCRCPLGITGKSGEKPARSRHCMWEATGKEPLELRFGEGQGLR